MAMRDDFCVFILSHGRSDRVYTYNTLRKAGYTGRIYIVIDDDDASEDEYRDIYGDEVLQFCKRDVAEWTDDGDNFDHRKSVVYARNACWDLARQVGCRYFIQLDDDYTNFQLRFKGDGSPCCIPIRKRMDDVLKCLVEFYISSGTLSVAMAQTGEFIGGYGGGKTKGGGICRLRRKAMNSFICDIEREFSFFGRINEDVSTYTTLSRVGYVFLTVLQAMLNQKQTQSNPGGWTEEYLEVGTYVKSFYSVMYSPSCVKIGVLGDHRSPHFRIHHQINWHKTAPKILAEDMRASKKKGTGIL